MTEINSRPKIEYELRTKMEELFSMSGIFDKDVVEDEVRFFTNRFLDSLDWCIKKVIERSAPRSFWHPVFADYTFVRFEADQSVWRKSFEMINMRETGSLYNDLVDDYIDVFEINLERIINYVYGDPQLNYHEEEWTELVRNLITIGVSKDGRIYRMTDHFTVGQPLTDLYLKQVVRPGYFDSAVRSRFTSSEIMYQLRETERSRVFNKHGRIEAGGKVYYTGIVPEARLFLLNHPFEDTPREIFLVCGNETRSLGPETDFDIVLRNVLDILESLPEIIAAKYYPAEAKMKIYNFFIKHSMSTLKYYDHSEKRYLDANDMIARAKVVKTVDYLRGVKGYLIKDDLEYWLEQCAEYHTTNFTYEGENDVVRGS